MGETIQRRSRGFRRAAALVEGRVQGAARRRGFSVFRLLTHWREVVGPELAATTRPEKVTYGRGFGATLSVQCIGAAGPIVQMQAPRIVAKVNACYGYAAISRIAVRQTGAAGFAEPPAAFDPPRRVDEAVAARAEAYAGDVESPDLRAALATLGRNVLTRNA